MNTMQERTSSIMTSLVTDQVQVTATSNQVDLYQSSCREDASLLAAFADIATKAEAPPARNSQINVPFNRPRLVSETSVTTTDSSLPKIDYINKMDHLHKRTTVEIRPHHSEKHAQGKVTYRTILRKKFSWKNYPPLEKFLIANRDEYLRHSTLNYTIQQKQYNNHLTKQMIQLAAQYNLLFDDNDFSFVTIRDRIRCYYKSYVQSLKKKGILLGYAARKAGLVDDKDIETSASTAGKIYLPNV
jgi:hypothetical protein